MIVFVFGRAGSGKNYVSALIEEHFDLTHTDADVWLPEFMQELIRNKQHFTLEMVDTFVDRMVGEIKKLQSLSPRWIISQALYRHQNREHLQSHFQPSLFLEVDAPRPCIDHRLKARGDWVDLTYAHEMDPYFQTMPEAIRLNNAVDGPQHLLEQLFTIDTLKPFLRRRAAMPQRA